MLIAFLQDPASQPPETEPAPAGAAGIVEQLSNPSELIETLVHYAKEFAPSLVGALVTLLVGFWIAKMVSSGIRKGLGKTKVDPTLGHFLSNLAYIGLVVVVSITAVTTLGVKTASFVAILGAAGLAIGFALQGSLSNFAAGVMIMFFRPFRVGDWVDAAGQSGAVEEIQVFFSVMRSGDNKKIIIPNSAILNGSIVNYSAKKQRRIDLVFGIGYDDDMQKARKIILEVFGKEQRVLKDPAPVVAVSELGDSSVNFIARPWVKTADYWDVRWGLIEAVKAAFDAQGISIPFPQRDVHLFQEQAA